MTKPYIVRVPVTIEAESPEAALAAAEKKYGARPKKATEAPAAAYPAALRQHAVQTGVLDVGYGTASKIRWCDVDGVRWITDAHMAVVVDPELHVDGEPFPPIAKLIHVLKIGAAQPLKRFRLHAEVGEAFLDIRLVNFIEALYPACEWSPMGGGLDPVAAIVGHRMVGIVMPVRERLTIGHAYKQLREARWELESGDRLMARADKIRDAVKRVDAAEKRAAAAKKRADDARAVATDLRLLANEAATLDKATARRDAALAAVAEAEAELRAMGETP